jgi:hypothetical protein
MCGLRPNNHAGKATEADIDFNERGGMVMIRRLVVPLATCSR